MSDDYGIWVVVTDNMDADPVAALEGTWEEARLRLEVLMDEVGDILWLRRLPEIEILSVIEVDTNSLIGRTITWEELLDHPERYEQMPIEYLSDNGPIYQVISEQSLPNKASSSSGLGYIFKIIDPMRYKASRWEKPYAFQWWGENGWQDPS